MNHQVHTLQTLSARCVSVKQLSSVIYGSFELELMFEVAIRQLLAMDEALDELTRFAFEREQHVRTVRLLLCSSAADSSVLNTVVPYPISR